MEYIFILALCALFVALFLIYRWKQAEKIARFAQFTKLNNVSKNLEEPRFSGELNGRKIVIYQKQRRVGKGYHTDTIVEVESRKPANFFLALEPEMKQTFSSIKAIDNLARKVNEKMKTASGIPDLKIGDKDFDEAFIILGQPADLVKKFLNPSLRKQMLELKTTPQGFLPVDGPALYFSLELKPNKVIFTRKDDILDCVYYGKTVKMLFDLVEQIENKNNSNM